MGQRSVDCLLQDIAFALKQRMGPRELVPMLERLITVAPAGSEARQYGYLQLAELLLHSQPFRAASFARVVARESPSDRAWGLVGLALTLMGHYRAAVSAYRKALMMAPNHVGHLHNLGHVLDVGLDRYTEARTYLEMAHQKEPDVREIASSLAHAVARSGRISRAIDLLCGSVGMTKATASATIDTWLACPDEATQEQVP